MGTLKKLLIQQVEQLVPESRLKAGYGTLHRPALFDQIAEEVMQKIPADLELKVIDGVLSLNRREEQEPEDRFIAWGKVDFLPAQVPVFKDYLEKSIHESEFSAFFK